MFLDILVFSDDKIMITEHILCDDLVHVYYCGNYVGDAYRIINPNTQMNSYHLLQILVLSRFSDIYKRILTQSMYDSIVSIFSNRVHEMLNAIIVEHGLKIKIRPIVIYM